MPTAAPTARPARRPIRRWLTTLGVWTASPWMFAIFGLYILAWIVFDRKSLDWQGVASLATWLMALFIQRASHRDTQALHAKIDELIRVQRGARNELTKIDAEEPETIAEHREHDGELQAETLTARPRPATRTPAKS